MADLLEVIMIVSFGASWPLNVIKSYKSGVTKGKSLGFLCLIFFVYIAGIISKLLNEEMIVDVSEQTQEFACELFPITYLQEQQVEETNRTRFLEEIYYFPEEFAEEIMGIIQ